MSDLVEILRSLKRGPSSPQSTNSFDSATSGSSSAARRPSRGPPRPLHLSSSPAASKVQRYPFQQSPLTPESPCQILIISPMASTLTVPDRGAEPTSPTPSTSSYRRRLLSRSPRRLPPIPESELPSFGHTGTGWHHPSPRARANPGPHPESYGYMYRESSTGRSSESLICTRDRRQEYTNPPAPPTRRLLAEKERFEYDTPPPSYQTLDSLDDDMVWASKGFDDKQKHYYYSKQVAANRAEPPLLSFLDMD